MNHHYHPLLATIKYYYLSSSGFLFFHILGMSSSQLTSPHIFQRGNLQPPTSHYELSLLIIISIQYKPLLSIIKHYYLSSLLTIIIIIHYNLLTTIKYYYLSSSTTNGPIFPRPARALAVGVLPGGPQAAGAAARLQRRLEARPVDAE